GAVCPGPVGGSGGGDRHQLVGVAVAVAAGAVEGLLGGGAGAVLGEQRHRAVQLGLELLGHAGDAHALLDLVDRLVGEDVGDLLPGCGAEGVGVGGGDDREGGGGLGLGVEGEGLAGGCGGGVGGHVVSFGSG